MPRRLTAAGLSVVLALGACSSDDTATATTADEPTPLKPAEGPDLSEVEFTDATAGTDVRVQVRDNAFREPFLEVKVGTTVTFQNVGRTEHDIFPAVDGAFAPIERSYLEPGDAAALTFDEVGDFPYYCTLHGTTTKGMVGAVRAVE